MAYNCWFSQFHNFIYYQATIQRSVITSNKFLPLNGMLVNRPFALRGHVTSFLLKKSNCHKISALNGFALKFGMQDNFDVLYQFFGISRISTPCLKGGLVT